MPEGLQIVLLLMGYIAALVALGTCPWWLPILIDWLDRKRWQ